MWAGDLWGGQWGMKEAERGLVKVGSWEGKEEKNMGDSQNCTVGTAGHLLIPEEDQQGHEIFSSWAVPRGVCSCTVLPPPCSE